MIKKAQGCEILNLDGELIELADLGPDLDPESPKLEISDREEINIVLVKSERLNYGLVVDRISDTEEIVVKDPKPNQRSNIQRRYLYGGWLRRSNFRCGWYSRL